MKALMVGLVAVVSLAFAGASSAERAAGALANGRIAFVTSGGLASMNPDGSGAWGLVAGEYDAQPAWSPDGSRLAFVSRSAGRQGITVTDPDGRTSSIRLTVTYGAERPTWAPDGSRLVYAFGGDLYAVAATGGPTTTLTSSPGWDSWPAWSPDGKTIAFTRSADDNTEIWTLDLAGGTETRVATSAEAPSWSPRGELIYIADGTAYVRTAGGAVSGLIADVDPASPILWSPDATRFLFVRDNAIWLADASGRELGSLASGWQASWQPLAARSDSCTLWGTPGADVLVGSTGDDVICGLDGDDTVLGMNGSDLLGGGAGNDWLAGGQGYDRLFGDAGDDQLDARDGGGDVVVGGPGYDTGQLERADGALGVERRRYSGNLAAWRPVQASVSSPTDPAERAVDGRADDAWNPGGWPPQWIEVDLLVPTRIGRIRLVAGPQRPGVNHLVLGKGPATRGAYRLLATIKDATADRQEIILKPKRAWRGIRRLRIASQLVNYQAGAEWVSWHEIEVYAPPR